MSRSSDRIEAKHRAAIQKHCPTCGRVLATIGEQIWNECVWCGEKRVRRNRRAWDADAADMARINREWGAFDRDPPGS